MDQSPSTHYDNLSDTAKILVGRAIKDFLSKHPGPQDITLHTLYGFYSQPKELRRLAEKYNADMPPECAKGKKGPSK